MLLEKHSKRLPLGPVPRMRRRWHGNSLLQEGKLKSTHVRGALRSAASEKLLNRPVRSTPRTYSRVDMPGEWTACRGQRTEEVGRSMAPHGARTQPSDSALF